MVGPLLSQGTRHQISAGSAVGWDVVKGAILSCLYFLLLVRSDVESRKNSFFFRNVRLKGGTTSTMPSEVVAGRVATTVAALVQV
jgi:hypothetical protein